jgi:hypothetical protein
MKELAKHMADVIGHGMSEKCERHAEIAKEYFRDKWISVKDRLPDSEGDVLAMYLGVYKPKTVTYWFDAKRGGRFGTEPATHWMPLPEPPKGDKSDV